MSRFFVLNFERVSIDNIAKSGNQMVFGRQSCSLGTVGCAQLLEAGAHVMTG
jgi:hypothetical protein